MFVAAIDGNIIFAKQVIQLYAIIYTSILRSSNVILVRLVSSEIIMLILVYVFSVGIYGIIHLQVRQEEQG